MEDYDRKNKKFIFINNKRAKNSRDLRKNKNAKTAKMQKKKKKERKRERKKKKKKKKKKKWRCKLMVCQHLTVVESFNNGCKGKKKIYLRVFLVFF